MPRSSAWFPLLLLAPGCSANLLSGDVDGHPFDLVEAVHPTPAVAGWPRAEAIEAIGRLEAMDRGWYAGPIGWLDLEGHGEFAVALRSGLVEQGRATLFAGAGIVGASQPAEELAETETKFGALRDAISG